jgi:hypothetical protein
VIRNALRTAQSRSPRCRTPGKLWQKLWDFKFKDHRDPKAADDTLADREAFLSTLFDFSAGFRVETARFRFWLLKVRI